MPDRSRALLAATLGGIGGVPRAPGTAATFAVGIPSAYLMGFLPLSAAVFITVAVISLACFAAGAAERELGEHDSGEIVIDELAGYLVTMLGLPNSIGSLLLGFAAFRLFDIWKPWPVSVAHRRLKGGVSIVMDDVAAGVYAHALVWFILRLWP